MLGQPIRYLKTNKRVVEAMQEQDETISLPYFTVSPKLQANNPIFYLMICNAGLYLSTSPKVID